METEYLTVWTAAMRWATYAERTNLGMLLYNFIEPFIGRIYMGAYHAKKNFAVNKSI